MLEARAKRDGACRAQPAKKSGRRPIKDNSSERSERYVWGERSSFENSVLLPPHLIDRLDLAINISSSSTNFAISTV